MQKSLMIVVLAIVSLKSADAQDTCGSPIAAPGDSMSAELSNTGTFYFYPTAFNSSCVGTVVAYEFCYRYTRTKEIPEDVVGIVVLESVGENYRVVWTGDEREDRNCVTDTLLGVERCCGRTDLTADQMFTVGTDHGYGFVMPGTTQNILLTLETRASGYLLAAPALLSDPNTLPAVGSKLTPGNLDISFRQLQNIQQRSVQFIIQPLPSEPVQPLEPEVMDIVIGFEQTVYNTTERAHANVEICAAVTSGPLERAITVSFSTSSGTATTAAPADYMSTSMELTFVPNNTRNCAAVVIVEDDIPELTENFFATLTTADSATTLAPDRAQVNICNNIEANETTSIVPIAVPTAVGVSLLIGIAAVILILFACRKQETDVPKNEEQFEIAENDAYTAVVATERNEAYMTNTDSIPAVQNKAYGVTQSVDGNTLNREDTTGGGYYVVNQPIYAELSDQHTQHEDNIEHSYEYV